VTLPFHELTDQLERAARNGTRAHLAPDVVRALVESPAYSILTDERRKELVSTWRDKRPKALSASNSAPTGSNTEPSEMIGASAGTIPQLVHGAAARQALEEAAALSRPRQRGKR
jgi:hypothetical protein